MSLSGESPSLHLYNIQSVYTLMLHANTDSIFIGVANQLLTTNPRRASKSQITKLQAQNRKSSTMADPPIYKASPSNPKTPLWSGESDWSIHALLLWLVAPVSEFCHISTAIFHEFHPMQSFVLTRPLCLLFFCFSEPQSILDLSIHFKKTIFANWLCLVWSH
jgi:hypothetical protein